MKYGDPRLGNADRAGASNVPRKTYRYGTCSAQTGFPQLTLPAPKLSKVAKCHATSGQTRRWDHTKLDLPTATDTSVMASPVSSPARQSNAWGTASEVYVCLQYPNGLGNSDKAEHGVGPWPDQFAVTRAEAGQYLPRRVPTPITRHQDRPRSPLRVGNKAPTVRVRTRTNNEDAS